MAVISVLDSTGAAQNLQTPNGNGQGTMANSRPVAIASDQSAISTKIDQTTPGTTNRVAPAALYTSGTYGTLSTGAYAVPNLDQYGNLRAVATMQSAAGQDTVPNSALGYWGNSAIAGNGGLPAITVPHVYNGSSWDRQRGDTNGTVNQPHAMASSRWSYASPVGGISNTAVAVTIANAAGAGVRNYITSIQLEAGALGAATEIAVRDGAGGTVLWRGKIETGGLPLTSIPLDGPLKGTANTLMEVVTLTASITGAVYFNAQGFQGS